MLLSETLAPAPADNADFEPPLTLADAVAAVNAYKPTLEAAWRAYNDADKAREPDASEKEAIWNAAEEEYAARLDAILDRVPVATIEDVLEKQRQYRLGYDGGAGAPCAILGVGGKHALPYEEATFAAEALLRDIASLSSPPAPSGAFGAALTAYKAANKEWRDLIRPVEMGEKPIKGDIYERTQQRSIEARDALYSTRTTVGAEIATKLALYYADYEQEFHESLEDDAATLAITDGYGASDDMRKALANIYLDLQQLAPPPAADRAAWEKARADYEGLYAAHRAAEAADRAATMAALADFPAELVEPCVHQGIGLRWMTDQCLEEDITLSTAEKERLRPLVREFAAKRSEFINRRYPDDDANEKLYDQVCDAEGVMLGLTPPDLEALAFKQAVVARESDDNKLGYDDLGQVAHLLHWYYPEANALQLHMDTLRMAGIDHPMLHLADFTPRDWIRTFEEAGGVVCSEQNENSVIFTWKGDLAPSARGQLDDLLATPWKTRAVAYCAAARRYSGGDPVLTAGGEARREAACRSIPVGIPLRQGLNVAFTINGTEIVAHARQIGATVAQAVAA